MVTFSSDHFRCCIAGTATGCLQRLPWRVRIAQAKVNYLYVVLVVEKQVLWLKISVADATFMYVLDARDNLLKKFASLLFLEPFSLHYVLEQFTSWGVFHNKEKLTASLNDLCQRLVRWLTSYSWITFGWRTFLSMLISRVTRSTSDLSLILSFSKIFMATCSLVIVWVPILTLPKVPCPSDLPKIISCINLTNNVVANCAVLFACSLLCYAQILCFIKTICVCDSCWKIKKR